MHPVKRKDIKMKLSLSNFRFLRKRSVLKKQLSDFRFTNYLLLISLITSCFPSDIQAETVEGAVINVVADTSRVYDLDEVVVISQPKEVFRLRQQAVSSSMFSATDLNRLNIHDLRSLSGYVPSFVMPNYGSRYTSSIYVRGIGSRVNNPAVGVYIDDIPLMTKSVFNFHSYGLERIDILRGPQGTLYGQNTEGGMVRMYSRNPMNYQGTDLSLSVGTHFFRNTELAHYQKLNDKLAFSLAGFYGGQNGFFHNVTTGKRADESNEAGGKFRLVFQPSDRWNVSYVADYQYVRQNAFPYGLLNLETGRTPAPESNRQGNYRRNMFNTGLNITYRANGFDVNSSTSYQYLRDYMLMDIDYTAVDYMHMIQRQKQNSFTQEFSLKNRSNGIWHWTTGAFFSNMALTTDAPVFFNSAMNAFLSRNITDYAYYGMLNSMAVRMGEEAAAALIARAGGCRIDMAIDPIPGYFRTPQSNIGLFHESNIDITPRLTATLGLRYDYSHVAIDYATSARTTLDESVMGTNVNASVSSSLNHHEHADFNQLLPKFSLTWKFDNQGSNLYATVSKGYRAGGYNIQMFSDILQTELQSNAQKARGDMVIEHNGDDYAAVREAISYKPETSWNYELGAHLNLFGQSTQLDLSTFYMQVRNQQLSVMTSNFGYGRMMVNAGKSFSCGIEATLRGRAVSNRLTWAASYSYTHAQFKEYKTADDVDYSDNHVPYVPQHLFSAMADYRFDLSNRGLRSITLGANVNGQGKIWWDEANSYSQRFYMLLGAHADADFGRIQVSTWVRNLTNTRYNSFAVQNGATGETLTFAQRGNPIQAGIDLRVHF